MGNIMANECDACASRSKGMGAFNNACVKDNGRTTRLLQNTCWQGYSWNAVFLSQRSAVNLTPALPIDK